MTGSEEDFAGHDGDGAELRSNWTRCVALVMWCLMVALPACGQDLFEDWSTGGEEGEGCGQGAPRHPLWLSTHFPVVGGWPADASLYPATGVLIYALKQASRGARPMGTMLCSASLVAPDVVIAAAHCQEPKLAEAETYFSLAADVSMTGPYGMRVPDDAVRVTHVALHPAYERSARTRRVGRVNDIALFYLGEPLATEPVRLPTPERAETLLRVGRAVDIVGYGRRSEWFYGGGDDGQKTWGPSTISDVGEYELEIGQADGDAFKCFGDSGGPTFAFDASGAPWMVGVTARGAALSLPEASFGQSSAACRTGGIDTRVDPYVSWMDRDMRSRCGSRQRPACDATQPGLSLD